MKWLALLLCVVLAACGGGGSASSVPAADQSPPGPLQAAAPTLDRYQPVYMTGQRLRGIVQRLDTGEQYTEWLAEPNKIWWSPTSAELFDVRVCEGRRWSFLLAFQDASLGQTYALQNVRTTLDGHELDCPQDGAPYEPFDIPLDFQQTVEQWGYVLNPGIPIPYYWKSTFVYGTVAENPCWIGNGPRIRSVIVQREVWWDKNGGWSRGHPVIAGALPWVSGVPTPIDVTMDFETKNALDAGILWRGGDTTAQLCLRDVVAWYRAASAMVMWSDIARVGLSLTARNDTTVDLVGGLNHAPATVLVYLCGGFYCDIVANALNSFPLLCPRGLGQRTRSLVGGEEGKADIFEIVGRNAHDGACVVRVM